MAKGNSKESKKTKQELTTPEAPIETQESAIETPEDCPAEAHESKGPKCPKCKKKKAQILHKYSEEKTLYRCTSCNHRWNE